MVGILTEKQAKALKLEALGYKQDEISKILGVSQARVSMLLKTAKEKIKKAKETVEFYEELEYIKKVKKSGYRGEIFLK